MPTHPTFPNLIHPVYMNKPPPRCPQLLLQTSLSSFTPLALSVRTSWTMEAPCRCYADAARYAGNIYPQRHSSPCLHYA